jgi:hypothetical protein
LTEIGRAHIGLAFGIVFVRAIFAGWLIALMVWLLPGAESARVSILIILTYLVGLGAFNHIVAGSRTVFLVVSHSLTWGEYFLRFFLPTLLGEHCRGSHPGRGARSCASGRWPRHARRRPRQPRRCRANTPPESASLRFLEIGKVEGRLFETAQSSAQSKIEVFC